MNLKAEISFFFGGTFAVICTITAKISAKMSSAEFAYFQWKAIHYIVILIIGIEKLNQFFSYQFRYLKKISAFSVKLAAAAKIWKQITIILFDKMVPCIFWIHSCQFSADAYGYYLSIRQFDFFDIFSFFYFFWSVLLIQIINHHIRN